MDQNLSASPVQTVIILSRERAARARRLTRVSSSRGPLARLYKSCMLTSWLIHLVYLALVWFSARLLAVSSFLDLHGAVCCSSLICILSAFVLGRLLGAPLFPSEQTGLSGFVCLCLSVAFPNDFSLHRVIRVLLCRREVVRRREIQIPWNMHTIRRIHLPCRVL